MYIQPYEILHVCEIQYILELKAVYFLREERHFRDVKVSQIDVKLGICVTRRKKEILVDVTFGNLTAKKHEDEVFLCDNILHFVLECSKFHQ